MKKRIELYTYKRTYCFPGRPNHHHGLFTIFEEGREIESRAVTRTPGVQAQFATLTVPSIFVIPIGFEPISDRS